MSSLNQLAAIIVSSKKEDAVRRAIERRSKEPLGPSASVSPASPPPKQLFRPSKPHLSVLEATTEAVRRKMTVKSTKLQASNVLDFDPQQFPVEFQRTLRRAEEIRREEQLLREAEIRRVRSSLFVSISCIVLFLWHSIES